MTPALSCRSLTVAYGSTVAVDRLDLEVGSAETVALLGPSGSGKTTFLYAVAGFVTPTGGEIDIAGRSAASASGGLAPEERNVAMVFQNYALWPHLTALETVAYPMRRSGLGRAESEARSRELMERVGIAHLAQRRPSQLSGGQQQRVGLARALARDAPLYLFDEPTAHLDSALRSSVLEEIDERRRESGAAAVYATHDAAEAMSLADRVVLLRDGHLIQVGTPRTVYEEPVDRWAALLTGPASVVEAEAEATEPGRISIRLGDDRFVAAGGPPGTRGPASLVVRPDWAELGGNLSGTVSQVRYRGPHTDYSLDTGAGTVLVRATGPPRAQRGEVVGWTLQRAWVLGDEETRGGPGGAR